MNTVLDPRAGDHSSAPPGARLRATVAPCRLSISWLGARKSFTPAQKSRATKPSGAGEEFLFAGRKLLDARHPSFKTATAVKNRAVCLWRGVGLPHPEPGVRLIRRCETDGFNQQVNDLRTEPKAAVRTTKSSRRRPASGWGALLRERLSGLAQQPV